MEELEDPQHQSATASLVRELMHALEQRSKSPLHYINFGLIITVIFFSGVEYQRLNDHDSRIVSLEMEKVALGQVGVLNERMTALQSEVGRLRDRMDVYFSKPVTR